MITGVVSPNLEATIQVTVIGPARQLEIEAVIDTGFDGWLSLSSDSISHLGLAWRGRGRALLADGSDSVFDIYEGTVAWENGPRRIRVDEADTAPLVGMALLNGHELNIQVRPGGAVRIRLMQ
jgi:clan AA aspartic protease